MVKAGDVFTWDRTFSVDEVVRFKEISADRNVYHEETDADGRLIVHGLLVATLPTKIGGDIGLLARTMNYTFMRPVYTGDAIRCSITVTQVLEKGKGTFMTADCSCVNQEGIEVMKAFFDGIVIGK